MRKVLSILLAVLLIAALAACSDAQDNTEKDSPSAAPTEPATEAPRTIADDTAVMALSFTPPAGYASVYRSSGTKADGTLTEKDLVFKFDDNSQLGLVCLPNEKLEDNMSVDGLETMEAAGAVFYLMQSDTVIRAFTQHGSDIYGVAYQHEAGASTQPFDTLMQSLAFTGAAETELNDDPEELGAIRWAFDPAWKVVSLASEMGEDAERQTIEKACQWSISTDASNEEKISFSFHIRVYRNKKLADVLDASKTYEEVTVNGIVYSVEKDADKNYLYYTQQGDDVYLVMNWGIYNGMWYTRSDESFEAFDTLLNSISFESE